MKPNRTRIQPSRFNLQCFQGKSSNAGTNANLRQHMFVCCVDVRPRIYHRLNRPSPQPITGFSRQSHRAAVRLRAVSRVSTRTARALTPQVVEDRTGRLPL